VPCVTLRETTERPVTVTQGTNRLAPWPLTVAGVEAAWHSAIGRRIKGNQSARPEGWDGHAAERIVDALSQRR